jgi:TatD DNase family protein
MYFDSHSHLYFEDYDADREELIEKLFSSEIEGIITVGVDQKTNEQCLALADKYPRIYAAVRFSSERYSPN